MFVRLILFTFPTEGNYRTTICITVYLALNVNVKSGRNILGSLFVLIECNFNQLLHLASLYINSLVYAKYNPVLLKSSIH